MRVLCLYPSLISGWASYKEKGSNESSFMDHGLAMLSAILKRAGHQSFCMDLRSFQNWQHFEAVLKQQTFDFTIVSFFSANERFARQAVEIMKRNFPDKYIIGGGVHLSVTQTGQYPNMDSIVLGEGEPHILEIADTIARGGKPQVVYELKMVEDLDTLPYVDRELFNPRMEETSPLLAGLSQPFITIVAGRGCWGKCTFCAPSRTLISGKRIRIRSVDNFLGEIIELNKRQGGIGSLMIHDDLLGTKEWITEFIEKWNKNLPRIPWWCQLRADTILKMKEFIPALSDIGMTYVSVGLESGSQRMLDFLQKGTTVEENIEACKILHDNDINIFANYIVGLPTETQEDLDATGRMLEKIRPAFHS
ncbi:MAG: radical SAM protein, partial [Planctomycetota bacterium]|nr:radical SAM protein [Planctomycetota bacterium]